MHIDGKVADFIEKQRSASGAFNQALFGVDRAGEGALGVAEKLGLNERGNQRRTVHGNKRLVAARSGKMNRAGDQLLARATLAQNQDGIIVLTDLFNELIHALHFRGRTDQFAITRARTNLLAQNTILVIEFLPPDQTLDLAAKLVHVKRFHKVIGRAQTRHFHGRLYRVVLGEYQYANLRVVFAYGLCLGPVNESTPDGLPVLFIKDIPPVSSISLQVTRPEIYYGERPNNYCFVKTGAREFDYPSGEQNVYTVYQGSGGIRVGSFWRRLLFALRFSNINILLSGYMQPASRIMIHRRILARVERLAPFLSYDRHPYLVVASDGSLQWIVDAYTTSRHYPYSEPTAGVGNYIRNSVKITISAYDGRVRFYISDPSDPLIRAYARIFPGVFHPLSEMPPDLRAHLRYPQDLFAIQAAKYAVYHMTDPRVFYSKEDLWRVATRMASGTSAPMKPYYAVMKLPEVGKTEEFILMVPFTPASKNNMIAWMAARCDGADYGKVLVFTFPKEKLIYGPEQIQSRVNQNPSISQQLTLWDQGGSRVIRGTLLVVPVQNAVLYVEPLYLAAESGASLPELKRVIVAYSDHVVMERSLGDALNVIFGGAGASAESSRPAGPAGTTVSAPAKTVPRSLQSLVQQANQRYERAQQDLRQGNWNGYGQEIQRLGQILKQMRVKDR